MEVKQLLEQAQGAINQVDSSARGQLSDGYHSSDELYTFRKLYNACFFNLLYDAGHHVVKSRKHHDGENCFGGGWFVVVAYLPQPDGVYVQVSNHYKEEDWDLFQCKEVEKGPEWDGHTAQDVITRLTNFTQLNS